MTLNSKNITLSLAALLSLSGAFAARQSGPVKAQDVNYHQLSGDFRVSMRLLLDSVELAPNRQLFVTPVMEDGSGHAVAFPTVLLNGRNMHYAYERGTLPKDLFSRYDIMREVRRDNGRPQSLDYAAVTPWQDWMYGSGLTMTLLTDTCGCGVWGGTGVAKLPSPDFNPVERMVPAYVTPKVTALPVAIHEGKARVQFEVDKTVLHDSIYVCRNGQRIDNRAQLQIIYDSVSYALSDPNVEIASIDVCGYASPESPYTHNDYLATNRSRALAEYLGERFRLPAGSTTYSAVPENWEEFREMVVAAGDITDEQRADLLELIDAPAYGPADYDAKENTLKNDRRFAKLYRSKILPEWFPKLRATKFAITTRLRPASDEKLAQIINETPELMSLNQMFRAAKVFPEGSADYDRIIMIAARQYPDSEEANMNAAASLLRQKRYEEAAPYLEKAGNSAEAENARGILAASRHDFDAARRHFDAAATLPEARTNRALLP